MPAIRIIRRPLGASVSKRRGFRARGGALLGASALGLTMLASACADTPVAKARIVADTTDTGPVTVQATQVFKTMKIILDINGDKVELDGTNLTPDTPVTVNGRSGRFGDLTPTQQQQLKQALQAVPPIDVTTITAVAKAGKAGDKTPVVSVMKTMKILLNIHGDRVELDGTNLTPDTPVTVNGRSGRFGDLTPTQQQQLRDALDKVKTLPSGLPESINGVVMETLKGANVPDGVKEQVILQLKAQDGAAADRP